MASARFRDDIINDEFILRVLKHHLAGKEVELVEFSADAGTSKGDNYMGDLVSVEVSAKVDGAPQKFHWMVKLLKPDPPNGGKHIGRVMRVFVREMNMYNKVLPALNKIGSVAHCPVIFIDETDGHEALVLEHMKQHGWRDPLNKKAGLTLEHVKLVVEWMAHLHGLGHVLINQYPGGPEAWHRDNRWSISMAIERPEIMAKFMEMMKDEQKKKFLRVAEILKEENPGGYDYVKHVLDFFDKNIWVDDLRMKAQLTDGRPFATVCHLDPWFNNMLFHYGDAGDLQKPAKVLLLDFQLSAFTIPANDLTYFLLCSTTPAFRNEHLDSVLKHYHESLVRVVKESGMSDFSYTFDQLMSDYELCLNVGPMLIMFVLPMMLNIDPEDAVDFGSIDILDEGSKAQLEKFNTANFEELIQRHPYLKDRIKGVFDDTIRAGVF